MEKEHINYFIYARKSTEGEDRQSLSISSQIEDVARVQSQQALRVIDTVSDSASAKIPFNRPQYAAMIKRIKKGEAQGIIVWKIDRLARNHLEWGELMHLLQTGVIRSIWTMHREYQSSDSALLISLEASMATQFSVDLSEIVKRGLEKKVAMGQPPLIARTGYLNTKLNEHGSNSIVVDPKRFKLMRKAFDLMLTRQYTLIQILATLNVEYGFRTRPGRRRPGGPLSLSMLHRAFTDPFYAGYFRYKGKLHKGSYKAMITLEEFDTIQGVLKRKIKGKPQKHDFAFTGFIKCGVCGCTVVATKKVKHIKATGEYKSYVWYHCNKRQGSASCSDKKYTTEAEMVTMVEQELERLNLMPMYSEWAFKTIEEDHNETLRLHHDALTQIKAYEQKLHMELDTLLDLRISNELTETLYNQKKAERMALVIRVQEKRKRAESNVNDWIHQIKEKLDFAETILERFKNGDPKMQKRICNYIGENWVLKGQKLTFTRHKWFDDIQGIRNTLQPQNEAREPIKTYTAYKQSPYFQIVLSYLCSLRNHLRTRRE